MEKKILVLVDETVYSKRAVEYLILMDKVISGAKYFLFNVQPTISEYLIRDAHFDKDARIKLDKLREKNKQESEKLLRECKELMVKKGIDESRIETVSIPKVTDIVKDTLSFAKQINCDAILIGKRGTSKLEELFTHSVSAFLLEHIQTIPLWTVTEEVTSTNIAVAIDGSESALRAVEHVSFIFENNPDVKITLLHVTPKLRDYCPIEFEEESEVEELVIKGDKRCVESFFVHAKRILENAGIKDYQLEIKEIPSMVNIAKTIANEVENGNYGTLVLGRSGIGGSFFVGSVSRYCFYNITKSAVWIVP